MIRSILLLCCVLPFTLDTAHADETGTEREVIPPPSVSPDPDALERTRLGIPDELDERSLRADLWSELIHKASTAAELREELAVTRSEFRSGCSPILSISPGHQCKRLGKLSCE